MISFPATAKAFTEIGKERGWPPVTRAQFNALLGAHGALMVGNPEEVAEKILEHSEVLGGISRISFHHAFGFDLNRLASGRITTDAGLAIDPHEFAEAIHNHCHVRHEKRN
jgi:alkanesulfonate monooxygenase SsuD/methylene tetrahydromethanopterin reductase-like flavin-dependent oxidoreductase (luciferase family)